MRVRVTVTEIIDMRCAAGATLSLVDLTESDWQLFDDQVFKLGSAQDSAPGQFAVSARPVAAHQAWVME